MPADKTWMFCKSVFTCVPSLAVAAPGALPGLLRAANRELKARFANEQRHIRLTDSDLFNYDVLFMHGRANFHLTDEEKKDMAAVDGCGSSGTRRIF